jgi:hypothetical protein
MPINLEPVERWAEDRAETIQSESESFWNANVDDFSSMFAAGTACANALRHREGQLTNRFADYVGRISQEVLTEFFDWVQLIKQSVRRRDPNPRLWHLRNPHEAIWLGATADMVQLSDATRVRGDVAIFAFHGMNYNGSSTEAYRDYYKPLEEAWKIFKNGPNPDGLTSNVFIVSYDSMWTDEAERLASLYDVVTGLNYIMLAAIWDECERRATLTASAMIPRVKEFYANHSSMVLMSHSLGAFGAATIYSSLVGEDFHRGLRSPGLWINMQGAIPNQSLLAGRQFGRVPSFFHPELGPESYGLMMQFFARQDVTLSTMYMVARREAAIGKYGGYQASRQWWGPEILQRHDTTGITGSSHGIGNMPPGAAGYFPKLGTYIDSMRFEKQELFRSALHRASAAAKPVMAAIGLPLPVTYGRAFEGVRTGKRVVAYQRLAESASEDDK